MAKTDPLDSLWEKQDTGWWTHPLYGGIVKNGRAYECHAKSWEPETPTFTVRSTLTEARRRMRAYYEHPNP